MFSYEYFYLLKDIFYDIGVSIPIVKLKSNKIHIMCWGNCTCSTSEVLSELSWVLMVLLELKNYRFIMVLAPTLKLMYFGLYGYKV